ncbi:hypothetical protein [Paucihalobacter sp.]|uniref:hypothetical protein n=1 Tax=Paucihalobacter sp. TaxID=2850405 RepID=UPI003D161077
MRKIKNILKFMLVAAIFIGCTQDDEGDTSFVNSIAPPTNVSANVRITQDNTGLVTITPLAEGVSNFKVEFGDGSNPAEDIQPGNSVNHIYAEGVYEATITANGINGLATTVAQQIIVSFRPPENVEVSIENDAAISKRVNVNVTADFAMFYEVDFGETPGAEPLSSNIGAGISYTYAEAGTYTITIEVMGGAAETVTITEEFDVTSIEQPLASAPTPPFRASEDVISIFTTTYENVPGSDFFPDWGQGGCCGSGWTMFELEGDEMLQYTNLSYQGNQFGEAVDVSQMEFIHFDIWTADVLQSIEISLISLTNGERPVVVELTPNSWTSINIPISDYTDQDGFTVNDIHQIKYVGDPFAGGGTVFIDNIYFYRAATVQNTLAGDWKMAPEAGSLGVGPAPGNVEWFNCDAACVEQRACYFDDIYRFGTDGSFANILGDESWIEPWQGGGDACGTPVAPHDGSNPATYVYNVAAGTVTLNGVGAYIGLAKANNQGELPNVAVPNEVTYNVEFLDPATISVVVEAGAGVFWQYKLVRDGDPPSSPLAGNWVMAPEAGSLGVGPAPGNIEWFSCNAGCVAERACYFDDVYQFNADGSFTNILGSETWVEPWQGGGDACGAPVAPHDGSNPATYVYDEAAGTITLNGVGAFIGLPKANNQGELPNVAVPNSITYDVEFINDNTISIIIESGDGVFWQYRLNKI